MAKPWPFVLVAVLYLGTSPFHEGLNNPNEMTRIYGAVAFVQTGDFALDPVIRKWGGVDDKARREGRTYSSKAPWQTLVAIPAAAAAPGVLHALGFEASKRNQTFVIRGLSAVLPSLLFAFWILAWCHRRAVNLALPRSVGTAVGLSLTLGTMLYPYALTATGHGWAGIAVGGTYLCLIGLARRGPREPGWRRHAVLLGLFGGIAPFAEYPATLAVLPILLGALWNGPGWWSRAELAGWLALGGLVPISLGLWAHRRMWGDPFKTGYSFLDNPAYRQVVEDGFFGVSVPSAQALWGSLFSVETGLFVFSPVLLVGLAMMVMSAFPPREDDEGVGGIRRHQRIALIGLTSVTLMFLFISTYAGWRGGWTVGPRYILVVAPLLGLWALEAAAIRSLWPALAVTGSLSVAVTGLSAALYPHLSDVYRNPWASFVIPTYLEGLSPYGVAHLLGLDGWSANALHLIPLTAAMAVILGAGVSLRTRLGLRQLATRIAVFGITLATLGLVPETAPAAAELETRRLWSFWEPRRHQVERPPRPPNRVAHWLRQTQGTEIRVTSTSTPARGCRAGAAGCRYGPKPWQRFEVKRVHVGGQPVRGLHLHPIEGATVTAARSVPSQATQWVLYHALTDPSLRSDNSAPIQLELREGESVLAVTKTRIQPGWQRVVVPLSGTGTVSLSLSVEDEGSRSFVFDSDFLEEP